jgi:multiple sugar transport system substrate-binding protein
MAGPSTNDRNILDAQISRRSVLKLGATASAAAFLAACQASPQAASSPPATSPPASAPPSSAPPASPSASASASVVASPSASAESFAGTTIKVWTTLTPEKLVKNAKATWEARTGGKAEITTLDFGDVPIKYAGVIAGQDSTVDVLYTYAGFMGQFGERIYDDMSQLVPDTSAWLPSTLAIMSPGGVLRALPVHSETEIFIYNKEHFQAAGVDPDNIPQTWDELYALAPKLTQGKRYPCVVPWIAPTGRKSILYWLVYYNSLPDAKFVSDDYTQILFDNDLGLETWQAIDRGFKANFFDPVGVSLQNDYESGLVFNQGQSASQINYSELWGQAVSGNTADFKATIKPEVVGASVMPGIRAGTHGGSNGFEGFGVNKFSQQKEAAASFIKEVAGFEIQKAMNLTKILPSSRIDVLNDPEVVKTYSLAPTLVEQGKYNAYFVNTPYVVQPVFADATTKLYKKQYTPEQAHEAAVKGVKDLIVEYLTT